MSASFLQHNDNNIVIRNVNFVENAARHGGAVFGEYHIYVDDQVERSYFYDRTFGEPSLFINHTRFARNSARANGGSVRLNNVPTLMMNITMEDNTAVKRGGACALDRGSELLLINGTFRRNRARNGGGLLIGERTMVHCVDCTISRNKAKHEGGGVSIVSVIARLQTIAFQCDGCSINRNVAQLGGKVRLDNRLSKV